MNVVSNLVCDQYPQPMGIANIDQIDVDLWIEVRRDSTKSIGDGWLALGPNKIDKKFRNFTANFQAYGWYEGYSAGEYVHTPKSTDGLIDTVIGINAFLGDAFTNNPIFLRLPLTVTEDVCQLRLLVLAFRHLGSSHTQQYLHSSGQLLQRGTWCHTEQVRTSRRIG